MSGEYGPGKWRDVPEWPGYYIMDCPIPILVEPQMSVGGPVPRKYLYVYVMAIDDGTAYYVYPHAKCDLVHRAEKNERWLDIDKVVL